MPNEHIIEQFVKLVAQVQADIDNKIEGSSLFRLRSLKNVLKVLKGLNIEIKSIADIQGIKGISKSTIEKIDEILKTGILSEIRCQNTNQDDTYVEDLEAIFGIGHKKALDLVKNHKIHSVKELTHAYESGKIKLSETIVMGIKYHGVYKENAPRDEITRIKEYILQIASEISKKIRIEICGSYRRGAMTSNDVDVLFTIEDAECSIDMRDFIGILKKRNFILDDLTHKDYTSRYMGFCKLDDSPVRRIDIKFIPYNSLYTALLYFTGSNNLNIAMRNKAKELGYKLNEYGLFKNDQIIPTESEEDVFKVLDIPYLEPTQRNV